MIDQKKLEQRFTMIRNGSEYPIACYNGNHYYIADGMRCANHFELCTGKHLDFGDEPQEPQKVVKPSSERCAPEDSTKWKCNWISCIGGAGLSGHGWCSMRGEWDNPKCPKFEKVPAHMYDKPVSQFTPDKGLLLTEKLDEWYERAEHGTSGDMVYDILKDWKAQLAKCQQAIRQEVYKEIGELLDNAEMNSTAGTRLPTLERMIAQLKSGELKETE